MKQDIGRIFFVGGGQMTRALLGTLSFRPCYVFDRHQSKVSFLEEAFNIQGIQALPESFSSSDIIILSIKPQHIKSFLQNQLSKSLLDQTWVISVAAGLRCHDIQELLPSARVVRLMPNTPVSVGSGVLAWFIPEVYDRLFLTSIFSQAGVSYCVDSEDQLDRITPISGCGPAYLFYWFEAWMQAGQSLGFDQEATKKLSLQTIRGALDLIEYSQKDPMELCRAVMSKGGATEQAVIHFDNHHMQSVMKNGILAAYHRSLELKNG
jgi:pyrroline-5-carboxylate reductase